jgi:hypothetical protein
MPKPTTPETGEQVPARPHDSGSAANETLDGTRATTEALRHAAEDTPSAANLMILIKRRCSTAPVMHRKSNGADVDAVNSARLNLQELPKKKN